MSSRSPGAAALLQRLVDVGTRRVHSGSESREDGDDECQRCREHKDLPVERRLQHGRPRDGRKKPAQRAAEHACQHQAAHRAGHGHQQRLGEKLLG